MKKILWMVLGSLLIVLPIANTLPIPSENTQERSWRLCLKKSIRSYLEKPIVHILLWFAAGTLFVVHFQEDLQELWKQLHGIPTYQSQLAYKHKILREAQNGATWQAGNAVLPEEYL